VTSNKLVDYKSIPFRLIEQKGEANTCVIVLPGAGYTTQAPLLHFTTGLYYTKGFDILHINYTFSRQEMVDLNEENFSRDVQLAIDNALMNKKYDHYYVVAKSIGTKALGYLLHHPMWKDAKVVWLTPLLQNDLVFDEMVNSDYKGLCIFGGNDHTCFSLDRFEKLKTNQNLILKVVEGGNHNLELDEDPIKSIEILKNIISDIADF
jgi:hypothetical protein